MSFSASSAVSGTPNFGIIDIDAQEVAKCLQLYLERGSKLTGVSIDDICVNVTKIPDNLAAAKLTDLLKCGMKLFDAIVWITAGRPVSRPLRVDPTLKEAELPSMHDIARSVFYVYFFLLTQARYPAASVSKDKPNVPNFLRVIMGMEKDQSHYVETICSFEPQKFDPAWARFVNFSNFGQESLSRFGLGVAGYRLFGPFKLYKPRDDMLEALQPAVDFATAVAKADASWEVHPLTRSPNVLTKRGNLNKNLGNLILEVFTDEQIDEMVASKLLYAKPVREPTCLNYKTWSAADDITGTGFIFRS